MSGQTVLQTLFDYYASFSTLDVHAVVPYFHEPAVLIGPPGVIVAPTHSILKAVFLPIIEGLRARAYGRSELRVGRAESLSDTASLVTGVAIRYQADGQELERVGVTYVMHKAEGGWKIAVLIAHDPIAGAEG